MTGTDKHDEEYEIVGRVFETSFPGRCAIDFEHVIRRGTVVGRVQHADNPMLVVPGVACASCVKILPRASR